MTTHHHGDDPAPYYRIRPRRDQDPATTPRPVASAVDATSDQEETDAATTPTKPPPRKDPIMLGWFVLWVGLGAAILVLVIVKITKWHELLIIGGFGFLTGMLGWDQIGAYIGQVWERIFS